MSRYLTRVRKKYKNCRKINNLFVVKISVIYFYISEICRYISEICRYISEIPCIYIND